MNGNDVLEHIDCCESCQIEENYTKQEKHCAEKLCME